MEKVLMNALGFFIDTVGSAVVFILMVRFLLQLAKCNYYHPMVQIIVKLTDPVIRPMRRLVPSIGIIDTASIVILFVLQLAELYILTLLAGMRGHPIGMIIWTIGELAGAAVHVYFYSIIVQAILSWVNAGSSPISGILHMLNEPLLGRLRNIIPLLGGIDLSPLAALIGLQLLNIIIVAPVISLGMQLS